jgi:hypothetical protein
VARGGNHTSPFCNCRFIPQRGNDCRLTERNLDEVLQSSISNRRSAIPVAFPAGRSQFERQLCSRQGHPNTGTRRDPDVHPSSTSISASGQPESDQHPWRQDRYRIPVPRNRSLDWHEACHPVPQPNRSYPAGEALFSCQRWSPQVWPGCPTPAVPRAVSM